MAITVYTKPGCVQCRSTERWLDKKGVEYEDIDITKSPDDLQAVLALGYKAAPVVVVSRPETHEDVHWYGFNPYMLAEHCLRD